MRREKRELQPGGLLLGESVALKSSNLFPFILVDFQRLRTRNQPAPHVLGVNLCNSAVYFEAAGVAAPMFGSFGIESDHMTVGGFIDELRSAR